MPWETFQRPTTRADAGAQIAVSIHRRGHLSLSQYAWLAIGSPAAVELLYDRQDRVVGLRSVPRETPHAYAVRRVRSRTAPYAVHASAFLRHYGLEVAVSERRPAEVRDGVLCVDLTQPGRPLASNRSKPA